MSQLTNSTPSRANLIYPTPSLNETQALACSLESRRPACALTPDDSGVMNNLSFSKTACPLVWVSLVGLKRRLVSLHDPGGCQLAGWKRRQANLPGSGGCQLVGLERRLVSLHDPGGCPLTGWKRRQANLPGSGGCQLVGLERRLASSQGPGGRQLEAALGEIKGASSTPLFGCLLDDVSSCTA